MAKRIGNAVFTRREPPTRCARCKTKVECRDILGNGTLICFLCSTQKERDQYGRRQHNAIRRKHRLCLQCGRPAVTTLCEVHRLARNQRKRLERIQERERT